ncbi:MAG: co-chaperone GroES [Phycisphaera sp.]|nr:co-chaperone GroES [Phycisphaera sp.]
MATATASQVKVRPLGDKILVKRVEAETKTKSGIFLPESAKEKPQEAQVIAVGDGKLLDDGKRAPFQVKKGDRILITKWGGTEFKLEDTEYLIMSEDDVLAVLEK